MALKDLPPPSGVDRPEPGGSSRSLDLSSMTVNELLTLRAEIDSFLPGKSIREISAEEELVLHLAAAKQLRAETLDDDDTPANQKAQVLGALTSVIEKLAKMQQELFDSERMKKLEALLIEVMREQPMELQRAFMQGYEARLGGT